MRVYDLPDAKGHFGPYGGVFVSETLISALEDLKAAYARFKDDPTFKAEFAYELKHYVGRPSPIYHARRWSEHFGGAQVYLKREDLNHTGAHKINNVIGQALLARHLGKPRVIAETGAGQHAWQLQPLPRATAWNAWFTWAPKTSSVRRRMSTG